MFEATMTAADVQEIIAQLVVKHGTLILPTMAAAAVLLTVLGVAGRLSGSDPVAARLATGVSRGGRTVAPSGRLRGKRST
jgi:hypothetical protein